MKQGEEVVLGRSKKAHIVNIQEAGAFGRIETFCRFVVASNEYSKPLKPMPVCKTCEKAWGTLLAKKGEKHG
mgnify:CR=1 FL=1